MSEIAFESWARPLAFIHALSAIVLVGALTHGSVFLLLSTRKAREGNIRRAARFWPVILPALFLTLLSGSLAYPTYRIRTRAEFLDRHHPLTAGFFDLKENYAAIVMVLIIACWLLRREPSGSPARTFLHDPLFHLASTLAWVSFVCGLWVTLHRGIG
ncbi:MAG: hypothetical protein AB1405_06620 [Bdellovibrionota bacterium]